MRIIGNLRGEHCPPQAGNFFDSLFRLTIYGKTMVMHQDFLVKTEYGYPPIYMKNIFAFFKKGRELILGPKKKDFLFKKEESHVCKTGANFL